MPRMKDSHADTEVSALIPRGRAIIDPPKKKGCAKTFGSSLANASTALREG